MRVSFDASELGELARDLERVPAQLERRNRDTVEGGIRDVTNGWRRRAARTAGRHGRLYPSSIRAEVEGGGLSAVTGPVSSLPQGGMGRGFEWGVPSVISNPNPGWFLGRGGRWRRGGFAGQRVGQDAPHLDMTITMDEQEPKFTAAVAGDALPWW